MRMLPSAAARRALQPPPPAGGLAITEVLIAMALIALWVLATAGTQATSLKLQKSAGNRALAVTLANELSENMDANRAGSNAGNYALAARSTGTTAATDCNSTPCTPAQLAAHDLKQWSTRADQTLSLNSLSVTKSTTSSGLVQYAINVKWNETRGRQKYNNDGNTEVLTYTLTKVVRHAGS
jgi:type IV pilus assembly protein PilV